MDTDPGNEVDSDDDTSLPDIDHIRLRPMGLDIQVGSFLGASTFTLPQTRCTKGYQLTIPDFVGRQYEQHYTTTSSVHNYHKYSEQHCNLV